MKKIWTLFPLISLMLAGCISISSANDNPTPAPQFVTSTLPPTKSLVFPLTTVPGTPNAGTPNAESTPGTLEGTPPLNCKVQAVLLEDVTIPDDALVVAGETFTKTWRFKNTGTCHWSGFTINFLTGDPMGAPDSSPVLDTFSGSTVDVSVDLTAPTEDGAYSGYFTLKNAEGESILIGTEKTFWLKFIVDSEGESATPTAENTSENTALSKASCAVAENAAYVSQIKSLIDAEREKQGLPKLTMNSLLSNAAQSHAEDMACNNLLSHCGSDGSYVNTRIVAAGYSPSYSEEIIFASDSPQVAFNWWMNDKPHRDAILNTKSIQMGIGYAYLKSSTYGGYYTVDFASP